MEFNRRRFLQAGGTAALMGTTGCDSPHKALWPYTGLPNEAKPSFATPSGESVGLTTHALNRLTFGARPGQHERILRLAKRITADRSPLFQCRVSTATVCPTDRNAYRRRVP